MSFMMGRGLMPGGLPPQMQTDWQTRLGGLLSGDNALFNLGIGILANNNSNNLGEVLGRGVQQGLQQTQQAKQFKTHQDLLKARLDEIEDERKRRRGTTEALSKAYTPAGNMANMSFMDANNEAMAGGNPDFKMQPTEASFDISRALPEIMQVNPELGMQLYQQEQERQRQAQFQQQMQGMISGGGADWQKQAQLGALGSMGGIKGASSLIELAKLNKPDPNFDLNAAKYFDETGQYPPGYTPPQMRGQPQQAPQMPQQGGNLPTNNFGRDVSWSGPQFGAPGTTQTDLAEGTTTDASVAVLDPRNERPISGPLVTRMPSGLSPKQQRDYQMKQAEAQILNPLQQLEMGEKENKAQETVTKKQTALASAEESIRLVDEMIGSVDGKIPEHPGFRMAVGRSSMLGAQKIPGNDSYAFMSRLKQVRGKQFLEAFQALKGGGSITEKEGQKAEESMARMDNATTEGEFITAAREFQKIISDGRRRLEQNAGKSNESGKRPPMKGQVVNGWKFMGGNPADQNNWRKQ